MRQTAFRIWLRHALALMCGLPFLVTVVLRSPANLASITKADHYTVSACNYIGDASFALSGSLAAGMEGMDLLGCVIVGFVTALGGGTFRDIMIGRFPIWWTTALDEFVLVVAIGTATFFLWPPVSRRLRLTSTGEWLFWTDTLGLGVFAGSGTYTGVSHTPELHLIACACCGMFTATFGGLTRDVLIGRPPRILYSALELYALPAFLGGLACAATLRFESTLVMEAIMLGTWVTVYIRVLAVNHGIRLPTFPADAIYSKSARPRDVAAEVAREEEFVRESCLLGRSDEVARRAACLGLVENKPVSVDGTPRVEAFRLDGAPAVVSCR